MVQDLYNRICTTGPFSLAGPLTDLPRCTASFLRASRTPSAGSLVTMSGRPSVVKLASLTTPSLCIRPTQKRSSPGSSKVGGGMLAHIGLVNHICMNEMGHHWFRHKVVGAKTIPGSVLTYHWLVPWTHMQSILTTQCSFKKCDLHVRLFGHVTYQRSINKILDINLWICNMSAILFRPKCVCMPMGMSSNCIYPLPWSDFSEFLNRPVHCFI